MEKITCILFRQSVSLYITPRYCYRKLAAYTTEAALAEAKAKGLLDAFSVEKLRAARRATANAVRVDDFPAEYFRPHRQEEPPHHDQRERKTDRTSA